MDDQLWQSAYEWRLVKAERGLHEAKQALEQIGHGAREQEQLDEKIGRVRELIEELHGVWDRHYTP